MSYRQPLPNHHRQNQRLLMLQMLFHQRNLHLLRQYRLLELFLMMNHRRHLNHR